MSKGGAGKVYFVLYLAVILELLIIIVERDEAEEHLIAKQKESMKIVQSILSQLQTGTGVEGLATRPQDQIVLIDPSWPGEIKTMMKEDRRYQVDVGVTDVLNDVPKICKDEKLSPKEKQDRLANFALSSNVRELQYQIWQTNGTNKDTVPVFPKDSEIEDAINKMGNGFNSVTIGSWTLKGFRTAKYNPEATLKTPIPTEVDGALSWFSTTTPVYEFDAPKGEYLKFAPKEDKSPNAQFSYDHPLTINQGGKQLRALKVRAFVAGFNPSGGEGLYKLHFFSRTNKIMGIRADGPVQAYEAPDEEKVNIGTVQLTVKDLRSVLRELEREDIDKRIDEKTKQLYAGSDKGGISAKEYRESVKTIVDEISLKNPDEASRMKLYGYIKMILRPNASEELEPNQASLGFSIRVVKPNIPKAEPKLADLVKSQRVISGVKKVVIAFAVNDWKAGNTYPSPTISPADATARIVKVKETPGAVGMVNIQFEVHVEGVNSSGAVKEYKVNLSNGSLPWTSTLSDGSEPISSIYVYPNGLANKTALEAILDKRVFVGRPARFPVEPTSGGEIPANQFVLTSIIDGAPTSAQGSNPLAIATACIGKNVRSVGISVKWVYKPLGTQYTEEVPIFEKSSSNIQLSQPEILMANASESWDVKTKKHTISGIEVIAPKVDCGVSASGDQIQTDVSVDPPSSGKYNFLPSIESTGGGQYRVVIGVKGNGKFQGADVEVTVKATVGKKTVVEKRTVNIPELK